MGHRNSHLSRERLGFKALATTSAGVAFSNGKPDTTPALPLDLMLAHIREIIGTGVAGLSIEDNTGQRDSPLYEKSLATERVWAARKAIDSSGIPVILTGRCEAWLVRQPDSLRTALDRLVAYAEARADCLYAPGVTNLSEIEEIVKAVSPKPVNVLVSSPNKELTASRLADLGVRRISVGSSLARVAWGAFLHAAREIATAGTFNAFADAIPFADINETFLKR